MNNGTTLPTRGSYDVVAAAEYLSLSARQVRDLINEGHIAAYVPRGMKRNRHINIEELDRYRLESAMQVAS